MEKQRQEEILKAYELVIADIAQDIGYIEGAQETTLSVLRGRVHELKNVWFADEEKEEEALKSLTAKIDTEKFLKWLFSEEEDEKLLKLAEDGVTGVDDKPDWFKKEI